MRLEMAPISDFGATEVIVTARCGVHGEVQLRGPDRPARVQGSQLGRTVAMVTQPTQPHDNWAEHERTYKGFVRGVLRGYHRVWRTAVSDCAAATATMR